MSLLNRVRKKFSSETEEIEISWNKTEKLFKDKKETEIESARERSRELINATDDIVQRLEENLKELKGYKDREELDVVEDVAESFYRSRKRLVENFDPSDEIKEHQEDLREFLSEFNDVSRKQGAVMKRVEQDSGRLSSSLDELLDHTEEIEDFLEGRYKAVKNMERVSNLEGEIQDLKKKIKEIEEELENKETEPLESKIAETEEEIEKLKRSEEYQEKEELEDELERRKEEKKNLRKDISGQVSGLERGLKKLTYNVRNNGIEFENNLEKLQKIREEEFDKVENPKPELDEALQIVKDENMIDGRQLGKFEDSVEALSNYDEKIAKIKELDKEIGDLKEKISQFEIEDRIKDLKGRKKDLERKLEEKRDRMKKRRERIEQLRKKAESKRKNLEKTLDSYLDAEVEVKETE